MEPFKNKISEGVAFELGHLVRRVWPAFPTRRYRAALRGSLEPLELKARGQLVGQVLWEQLPGPAAYNFELLTAALQSLPVADGPDGHHGWPMFPMDMILGAQGPQAFDPALRFAREVTQRFTAEFGIRSLLLADPDRGLAALLDWTQDESVHLRRLASEGSRPRLPWGQRLSFLLEDPRPTRPILEALRDDPEEYVRRSVANHWNDVSKDHPEYVVEALQAWHAQGSPERRKLVRHACRSLIKAGHGGALDLLGYAPARLHSAELQLRPKRFTLGGSLEARVRVTGKGSAAQDLILDFRFHLVKADGRTSAKVFKGRTVTLAEETPLDFRQRFPLKPVTTRRYYPGKTRVELLANGEVIAEDSFHLAVP